MRCNATSATTRSHGKRGPGSRLRRTRSAGSSLAGTSSRSRSSCPAISSSDGSRFLPLAQVAGAVVAGGVLYLIASGQAGFDASTGFASNGYGELSPGKYSFSAALICEIVMTMMFLVIILGATDPRAPQGMAPIAIGLGLTLIHLISIPVTNTSVNPARSLGVALYAGAPYLAQVWLFWVAPIIGAVLGAAVYRFIGANEISQ